MKNPFEYQKPTEMSVELIKNLRNDCEALHKRILTEISECRERSLAITKLEEVSMWANKAIVFTQKEDENTSS